ncbi:MAG: hypothetical protein JSW34_07605 [Candidatus Zixiibacteriota bacterium]|nr:MAG: hypothetical protein JSW34_07605 [candidate division Zixibacteria bacterium]
MKKSTLIVMAVVVVLFLLSWVLKASALQPEQGSYILRGFLVTFAAFLTLAVMSFLYQDNPFYKFAEHLFVGVSAAFWMCMGFWTTIVQNLIPRLSTSLADYFMVPQRPEGLNLFFYTPVILGILLLMRLSPRGGWISRWPLAFIVGTTAGLNFIRYLRSDFIKQISSTFVPLLGTQWEGIGPFLSNLDLSASGQLVLLLSNWVVFLGVFTGLIYFFFSKEHKGAFGVGSRVGIWILMITFGASFGYTVMGRISLLVGRITFLFGTWLELI